jgi:hypothetical protein
VYLTTIIRILNAPAHPFDYAATADEMREAVAKYHEAAAGEADLSPVVDDLARLAGELRRWQADGARRAATSASERRAHNAALRRVARVLVALNYAKGERFDHDPALKLGPVPRLEAAASIASAPEAMRPFIRVGLTRELNKVRAMLRAVTREMRG